MRTSSVDRMRQVDADTTHRTKEALPSAQIVKGLTVGYLKVVNAMRERDANEVGNALRISRETVGTTDARGMMAHVDVIHRTHARHWMRPDGATVAPSSLAYVPRDDLRALSATAQDARLASRHLRGGATDVLPGRDDGKRQVTQGPAKPFTVAEIDAIRSNRDAASIVADWARGAQSSALHTTERAASLQHAICDGARDTGAADVPRLARMLASSRRELGDLYPVTERVVFAQLGHHAKKALRKALDAVK